MGTARSRRLRRLAAAIIFAAAASPAFSADLDWKASALFDYETGKFGTAARTDTVYIPVTLKRYWGDWDAALTVPYLSETTNGQVTNVGGRPTRIHRTSGATTTTTESGLGDMLVRGGYAILTEDHQPLDLTAVGRIKLPTADRDKNLGTGEFDETLGLEAGKRVVDDWTVLADFYYTFIGSPPGTDLNDQAAFDLGFSHPLQKDLKLTVLFEESNPLVSGESAPLDLRGMLDYRLNERSRLYGGLLVGLSDGSPDFGLNLGASYRF
jgi:hypothetical protein